MILNNMNAVEKLLKHKTYIRNLVLFFNASHKKNSPCSLSLKHIKDLKVILNRENLLKLLPKKGVVAEIGVDLGDFSERILWITKPKRLHLIDPWKSKRYYEGLKIVESKFKNEIDRGKVVINIGSSTELSGKFKDNYFDWIYIDSSHSYEMTLIELKKYSKKVKKEGIISGHDFMIGNWNAKIKYGVINAVYEFCVIYNWKIIYLTMDYEESISFAIKRI